ncbi:kinase-like domain-containing protein [Crepidotus variabilis]|uniref:Kinase-like domain-containing protein n=1 Tax=Crepidotus variabilis TaxID=179855 RepID=A0A9P6EM19_9AGAR|nr:kinase-like domain-containing protein [Crepidotus variabilis]
MKHTQFLSSGALGLTDDFHTDSSHGCRESTPRLTFNTEASIYSSLFPQYHQLNANFVQAYQLEDELGSGGYGFVMIALDRVKGHEVAVKFIIKDKVPEHAWMEDESFGKLPTEVVLLSFINHENIVRCIDLFEDHLYYYLVQELHGCPWKKDHILEAQPHCKFSSSSLSTPALSPSTSVASLPASEPATPPTYYASLRDDTVPSGDHEDIPKLLQTHLSISQSGTRPDITRRPSHDLFECIEQSEHKRLTEAQARFVFAQVVDAVDYLDHHGIAHRDIKDENLVIDKHLKVKLIDFGSAIAVDPNEPRPYYQLFYGTAAYASSEILRKIDYQAAPAEIWTLGVLLSYLLAGISPFPNVRDAVDGRIFLSQKIVGKISPDAMDLMRQCLDPNPQTRTTLSQIKSHPWLNSQN